MKKIDVCLLHLDRLITLKNEDIAVREIRKHAAWYLKGMKGNAKARNGINSCSTRAELVELLTNYVEEMESNEVKVG